jgi:hypothetical protein
LYSEKSTANTVFLNQANHQLHFVSNSSKIKFTQVKILPLTLSKLIFVNAEIGNQKSISCLIQQPSLLRSTVELLMRLIIVASFGSVTIAGNFSLVQRYLHVISRDLIVIIRYVIFLLCILLMSSVFMLLFSSTHSSSSTSCPTPKFLLVKKSAGLFKIQ